MRIFRRLLFAVLLAALPIAGGARAQGPARVEVSLAPAAGGQNGAPMVRSIHIFSDHDIREMLHSSGLVGARV